MSISHRTNRLKLVGQPSVEQLQNGRYRLTVNCTTINSREDWYSANKDRIFPDFGSLQSAEMSIDGLAPREGEAYTDMRLTKVESGNRSGMGQVGDYKVELTYETLGSAFVQVKDDNTDYELNGLRRVTRTSIAEVGTDYAKTVGSSFIDHRINNETAVRCYLASYSVDDTDSFRQVQEVYVEAGTLSETLDNVGSQKAKVIETIGTDPITPDGYSLASKQESDFEGFQTNRFTFLRPGILSLQQDFNNGLKRVSVKAFDMTATAVSAELAAITTSHELISQDESDYEGIKTSTFQYQINESFMEDYELNGLKRVSLIELSDSDFSAQTVGGISTTVPTTGLYLGTQKIDNGGTIKVRESVWLESGTLSETLDNVGSQKAKVIQTIGTDPVAPSGYVLANKSESDFQGFQTNKFTFLKNNSILNTSTNSISDGVVEVSTTFFGAEGTVVGPVISRTTGDVEGIPTITVKTLQDNSGQPISGTGVISEFQQYVDFTYPGEVSIATDTDTVDGPAGEQPNYIFKSYWYSLKPPVTKKVLANVSISFQADGNLGITAPLWSPDGWAKGRVDGLGTNYKITTVQQTAQDKAFNQYTVVAGGDNSYSGTAGFGNTTGVILVEGTIILPLAAWSIEVSGGPGRPDGNTYTLDAKLTPAFTGADGTQYWKKTLVVATIPTR